MRVLRLPEVPAYYPPSRAMVRHKTQNTRHKTQKKYTSRQKTNNQIQGEKFMNDISASEGVVTVVVAFSGHLWLR